MLPIVARCEIRHCPLVRRDAPQAQRNSCQRQPGLKGKHVDQLLIKQNPKTSWRCFRLGVGKMDDQDFRSEIAAIQLPRKAERTETRTRNANLSTSSWLRIHHSILHTWKYTNCVICLPAGRSPHQHSCSCVTVIPMTVAGLGDDVIWKSLSLAVPHSATGWRHCLWQTCGRSRRPWGQGSRLWRWRTARCPGRLYSTRLEAATREGETVKGNCANVVTRLLKY